VAGTGKVDEYAPHQVSGDSKEMRAILPIGLLAIHQA
jgi:hypothetical protein